QYEDDDEHDRNHNLEPLLGADLVFVLAAPLDVISRRHRNPLSHDPLRFIHESANVASTHIHEHGSPQEPVFARDHRWSGHDPDIRDLAQRNLSAGWTGDENVSQVFQVFAKISRITYADRESLAALDRECEILSTDCRFDHVFRIADGDAIS